MAENDVFNITNFNLSSLVSNVDSGIIALPDLQRPFVWTDKQISDLIDSLYKGLPTGLIILWEIEGYEKYNDFGNSGKSTSPSRLVIDGQQRLTSLYTVFTGKTVIDKTYKQRQPKIAFNPATGEIKVLNPSLEKSPEWINNITEILKDDARLLSVMRDYISNIKEKKPDLEIDETLIENNIEKMRNIRSYSFSVIELSKELNPVQVAEIFVRINSKGKPLNQSDFILTLMSVYWDEGRKALEEFTRDCKIPAIDKSSPYTTMRATPDLEHLLRPIIAFSFLRSRLKYAYLILNGRNLENKTTTDEERDKNFEIFKEGQNIVLNLNNWHKYCELIESIGFVNYDLLISSKFTFYASYGIYLIGKYKFKVDYKRLEWIICKWFVFTLLTQRYTSSAESRYEQDLARFRQSDVDFVEVLSTIMETELTGDYWNITLPQILISSSNNYAGKIYTVSKIYEGNNILFSKYELKKHLSPEKKAIKKSIEIHHIFPKNYLIKNGIIDKTMFNQQANYIYIEYPDNIKIKDQSPAEYWPMMLDSLESEYDRQEIINNYTEYYDLPHEFWNMEYPEFLKARRKLMAKSIRNYFERL